MIQFKIPKLRNVHILMQVNGYNNIIVDRSVSRWWTVIITLAASSPSALLQPMLYAVTIIKS